MAIPSRGMPIMQGPSSVLVSRGPVASPTSSAGVATWVQHGAARRQSSPSPASFGQYRALSGTQGAAATVAVARQPIQPAVMPAVIQASAPVTPAAQGGEAVAGTWVTKTTVEKVFIPNDQQSQPPAATVPVQAAPIVQAAPTIQAAPAIQATGPRIIKASAVTPVKRLAPQRVENILVPAISGSAALAGGPEYGGQQEYDDGMGYAQEYPMDQQQWQHDQGYNYAPNYENGYNYDDQAEANYGYEDQGLSEQQLAEMQMQQQYADGGYIDEQVYEQVDNRWANGSPGNDLPSYQTSPDRHDFGGYNVGADFAAGMPRGLDEKQDESGAPAEDQFSRLLNSLEARVDLMAQMQHTRAEIQKHTKNLQGKGQQRPNNAMALPSTDQREPPIIQIETDRPFSSMLGQDQIQLVAGNSMRDEALLGGAGARLVRENAILKDEFQDQREQIAHLTQEVVGMKAHLQSISDPTGTRRLSGDDIIGVGSRVEAQWMRDDGTSAAFGNQWLAGIVCRVNEDGTYQVEYDNGAACLRVPLNCIRHLGQLDSTHTDNLEMTQLQMALMHEKQKHEMNSQQWSAERQRLLDELSTLKASANGGRRALGNLSTVGELDGECFGTSTSLSSMLHTSPVLPANSLHFTGIGRQGIAPLSRNPCGANIELSEDGYFAKRIRGCRQSVVMGSAPLEPQDLGHYFEVVVKETVNGWVGGLGIGVSRMSPQELKRMPDKAWRIPNTFIVGYWGCLFLDGRERRTRWKADTLTVGSRVGLLVTGDGRGDLIVFVDGEPVVRADDVLPSSGLRAEELYPVIDVFAATLAVEVQQNAICPPKPWSKDPSPPGSPGAGARSIGSSGSVLTQQTLQTAVSFNP